MIILRNPNWSEVICCRIRCLLKISTNHLKKTHLITTRKLLESGNRRIKYHIFHIKMNALTIQTMSITSNNIKTQRKMCCIPKSGNRIMKYQISTYYSTNKFSRNPMEALSQKSKQLSTHYTPLNFKLKHKIS